MSNGGQIEPAPALHSFGPTSTSLGPLPSRQLLRGDGGGRPLARPGRGPATPSAGVAIRAAVTQLGSVAAGGWPAAWRSPAFAARVERTRQQLAPIDHAALLATSYRSEAIHRWSGGASSDAVRMAYALRWLELRLGDPLPSWGAVVAATGTNASSSCENLPCTAAS
jgi:hypothetical protein